MTSKGIYSQGGSGSKGPGRRYDGVTFLFVSAYMSESPFIVSNIKKQKLNCSQALITLCIAGSTIRLSGGFLFGLGL
jgi:hypothetical protein